jgi:purine-nucleoside/S-methyl-5'-thioadenosine phosphorylase / adenosine deaminase
MSACAPDGERCDLHFVEQVHGSAVVVVGSGDPGRPRVRCAGAADALVSASPATGLAVLVADCAPVALASPEGVFAAVHAGWRGVCAGVVERAVAAMRELGAGSVTGVRGPCIRPCCYEFTETDLEGVAARYGPAVRSRARSGAAALDLPAAVSAALAAAGASEREGVEECTACGGGYFSHRARRDPGRQALVVWRTVEPVSG